MFSERLLKFVARKGKLENSLIKDFIAFSNFSRLTFLKCEN